MAETYSIKRLWIRISNLSQVLEPSPQGVLRVDILRVLVGSLTISQLAYTPKLNLK
jgi:hypothetical protein